MIDETGQRILRLIDVHKDQIIAFAEDIAAHPEPGYEEFRTAGKTAEVLKNLGYKVTEHLARTGVKGTKSIKEGPSLTVIGELDAIGCHSHPNANPVTGVAHACGHHAQMAAMIGCAIAMADPDVQKCLAGTVNFLAVPAEEYIDADKRARLKKEGIEFCCGKSEMIRTGVFDDTDIALTTHVHMVPVEEDFYLGNPACNGYSAERVTVRGKAAHGAIDPWNGVNALSITTSAIQMMGLMRETFREEDHVRLHNVIRKAGDVINSVPDEAIVETKVRAASLDKICEITDMVNRAYAGSAYAFGGKIEIHRKSPIFYQAFFTAASAPVHSPILSAFSFFLSHMVYHTRHIACAESVVNIDHGNTARARIQHRQQSGQTMKRRPIAHACRHCYHRTLGKSADDACQCALHTRYRDNYTCAHDIIQMCQRTV